MNVLHPEFNVFGFLVPLSLVAGVLGFLIAWLTVAVLERLQLTRYVGNVSRCHRDFRYAFKSTARRQ